MYALFAGAFVAGCPKRGGLEVSENLYLPVAIALYRCVAELPFTFFRFQIIPSYIVSAGVMEPYPVDPCRFHHRNDDWRSHEMTAKGGVWRIFIPMQWTVDAGDDHLIEGRYAFPVAFDPCFNPELPQGLIARGCGEVYCAFFKRQLVASDKFSVS